jgi:hypothetical protein
MSSYVFVSPGSDPGMGRPLHDPILASGVRPTMGSCRPDLRRNVRVGDQVFVISGSMGPKAGLSQYVIGGLVADRILDDQLAAYNEFPEYRLHYGSDGARTGNIIVNADGSQHAKDHHPADTFQRRIRAYLVGKDPVVIESPPEIALARERSVQILAEVLDVRGARTMRDVIGRNWRKLSAAQADRLRAALLDLKREARP